MPNKKKNINIGEPNSDGTGIGERRKTNDSHTHLWKLRRNFLAHFSGYRVFYFNI
jgi:hypothetical protein